MSSHNILTKLKLAKFNGGTMYVESTSAPTGSASGYAPGCKWTHSTASASILYINTGTLTSATWTAAGSNT